MIHGHAASAFSPVREAFQENFRRRGEIGAAACVYYRGAKVVDLWGGYRNPSDTSPWEEHTLVNVFSATTGMSAAAVAKAVSLGYLDYDGKVADYWPSFAQQGKGSITVRQLLGHEAGLPALERAMGFRELGDPDTLSAILAAQRPLWVPGKRHGCHASTLGLYIHELIRKADPAHRSLGEFFRDEIAEPMKVEFHIGLPDRIPDARLARVKPLNPLSALFRMPWKRARAVLNPRSLVRMAMALPRDADPNDRDYLRIGHGSGNGVGEVRAIAKVYGDMAMGGTAMGLTPEVFRDLCAGTSPLDGTEDLILKIPVRYHLGYHRPVMASLSEASMRSFGAPGQGGAFGYADPDRQLGYAYAMVKMGRRMSDDPREQALRDAVHACITNIEKWERSEGVVRKERIPISQTRGQ